MKPGLQLNIGQHLTLTPQLQQAIRLLQLSSLELNQEVQQLLETNPMLELEGAADRHTESRQEQRDETTSTDVAMRDENIPKDLPVDTAWEVLYPTGSGRASSSDTNTNFDNIHCTTPDLQEYLLWQMELSPFSDTDRLIAISLIDAINPEGMLTTTLEDIHQSLNEQLEEEDEPIDLDEIEMVLQRIQYFDPVGVGARDLSECLAIQLQQLPKDTPLVDKAIKVVQHCLPELGAHNYKAIIQKLKLNQQELQAIVEQIQQLTPNPGAKLANPKTEYIIPDVVIKKVNGRWRIELNPEALPRVRINNNYASLQQQANNKQDTKFIKDNLQEARWFIKSLQSRHDTLLKVASCIVERQQDFFEYGEEAMKPMVLNDISSLLDMHESTVSRVTTQKYMHTPRGVFELKYFFSSHVTTQSGGECSSTAIRAVIKKMITTEDRRKPLSDNKIAQILGGQGINVARRTIAKYREAMGVPASSERKSLPQN